MRTGDGKCIRSALLWWAAAMPLYGTPACEEKGTRAVLIGISRYHDQGLNWLEHAHDDATRLEAHLNNSTEGGLDKNHVIRLTNENAKLFKIGHELRVAVQKAGPRDCVYIFISAHGKADSGGAEGGFIMAYESVPGKESSTAYPVADLMRLLREAQSRHVFLLFDVCRQGAAGDNRINEEVERRLGSARSRVYGLLANQARNPSREKNDPEQSLFGRYLLRGLRGEADSRPIDDLISVLEMDQYLLRNVPQQHPRAFGERDRTVPLGQVRKRATTESRVLLAYGGVPAPGILAVFFPVPAPPPRPQDQGDTFSRLLEEGRLTGPGGAFEILQKLRGERSAEAWGEARDRLAVELADRGQQVIARYGSSDEFPLDPPEQQKGDFDRARESFDLAAGLRRDARLEAEARGLEARRWFCHGRSLVYEKNYTGAAEALSRAVQIDPQLPEPHNALGIAYLEQAKYADAAREFQEAIQQAPGWAYPHHNLALARIETGDYDDALKEYRAAIRVAPYFSYLYYNLGLLLHRLNRRSDAEREYLLALQVFREQAARFQDRGDKWAAAGRPAEAKWAGERAQALKRNQAEVHNALGALHASRGRRKDAQREYSRALAQNPRLFLARHNLALLEAAPRGKPEEAIRLWRENLDLDPAFLPSRVSLAEAYYEDRQWGPAAAEYRAALAVRPDYLPARLGLVRTLACGSDPGGDAVREVQKALQDHPGNAALYEELGDLYRRRGEKQLASEQYEIAQKLGGPMAGRRLRDKVRHIEDTRSPCPAPRLKAR